MPNCQPTIRSWEKHHGVGFSRRLQKEGWHLALQLWPPRMWDHTSLLFKWLHPQYSAMADLRHGINFLCRFSHLPSKTEMKAQNIPREYLSSSNSIPGITDWHPSTLSAGPLPIQLIPFIFTVPLYLPRSTREFPYHQWQRKAAIYTG